MLLTHSLKKMTTASFSLASNGSFDMDEMNHDRRRKSQTLSDMYNISVRKFDNDYK